MAKVRVPERKRPPSIQFVAEGTEDHDGVTYRCVAFRKPRAGDVYSLTGKIVLTATCPSYTYPEVILERVK
jgi:hypothetical protein